MNLLNHTLKYLVFAWFGIISVWAVIFYFNMLDEVYDSLDDGLDNFKMLIIEKAYHDSTTLQRNEFAEGNYELWEISEERALKIKDVHKDTLMYMPFEEDLEPVRMLTTAFKMDRKYYELKIISSMVEEDDLIEDLFYSLIWLYVAMLVSLFVVNNFLLKKLWKPFYSLLDQLKKFRLGKEHTVAPMKSNVKEFNVLNDSVATLMKHTIGTYNSQKQFIENASHELQTPVAISINKLELLAEKGDLSENNLDTVGQVIGTLQRLTRLNKSLLLLAKIENRQFENTEIVSFNQLLTNMKEEFSDFASFKEIEIKLQENGQLNAKVEKDLAIILITNLMKNAIVHNHKGGAIHIEINGDYFQISNSGKGEMLDGEKVFNRFQKDSSDKNNTGLGLAIVKAIADLYGFRLEYSFNGLHSMRVWVHSHKTFENI